MRFKLAINFLLAVVFFVAQLSLVRALPWGGVAPNLLLVALVFVVVLTDWETTLVWFLAIGLLGDLFSFHWFGLQSIIFLALAGVAFFLVRNFLTNRSLYVFLLLTVLVSLLYDSTMGLVYGLISANWWLAELKRLLFNLVAATSGFYCLSFISHRLRPVFLSKN